MGAGPRVSLIAALAENRVIGRDNRLPWRLPADLRRFKRLTLGKPILMGRKTWESLPGLLPERRHIVLTRDLAYQAPGCVLAHSLDDALAAAGEAPELMVIGGAELYRQLLPRADRLYLTLVRAEIPGDALFPPWDPAQWSTLGREDWPADPDHPHAYSFLVLERLRPGA